MDVTMVYKIKSRIHARHWTQCVIHNPGQYGKILSKSLKDNFDIDAIFPDRDSRRIFGFYYDLDNDLSDIEDDPYIDDNDYRRSLLNLSTPLQTEEMIVDTEKRPRTDDDEFIKPTRTAQRRKVSEKEIHPSISSQSSNDGKS